MHVKVATYNVLATAYIKPAHYPFTPPQWLDATLRIPALMAYLSRLDADILCLQEVEKEVFSGIQQSLSLRGYEGVWTKKGSGKPDGCATFVRQKSLAWGRFTWFEYNDSNTTGNEPARSGHIAQIVMLKAGGRSLGVINTHLKWDPPSTPRDYRYGYRQIIELLQARQELAAECEGWILCGDLNVTAADEIIQTLQECKFDYSHRHSPGVATCNSNRRAKMVDYVFHNDAIASTAVDLPQIHNDTPLPGPEQPSDHLAVMAYLWWRGELV